MPFYPKRRKNVRKPRAKRPYKKRAMKSSTRFTKAVQRIIHKDAETKQAFTNLVPTSFNSGISSLGDVIQVLPNVSQGTADNGRIGDQIRAQSLTVKGAVVWSPSVGSFGTFANSRLGVRIFIVQPRNLTDYTSVNGAYSSWQNILLKKGGTTSAFTGQLSDLWAPINSDAIIKYYDKVFYLNGTYQSTAVGSTQLLGSTKIFSHTFKLRNKLLKYDNTIGSGITPVNYAPVMLIGYCHMDGSGPDTVSTAVVAMADMILNYEDM